MERFQENRRVILIALLALVLLCLVGVLIYNVFFAAGGQNVAGEPPTATPVSTEEVEVDTPTPENTTPTPTRVISSASDEESTEEATMEPTSEATTEPTAAPTPASAASTAGGAGSTGGGASTSTTPVEVEEEVEVAQIEEVLKNGGFEEGFGDDGIGINWQGFSNNRGVVAFSAESAIPFVESGQSAQRISIDEGIEPDQYGGIYQQVTVTPGQVYTLTLNGQIRSGFGDIIASSYGYRLQYAIDYNGGQNWRALPSEEWVELPWDEQGFNADEFTFSEFSTQVTPTADTMTIFIRGWNKWPDQNLGEYTLDSLSLVGPVTRTMTITRMETAAAMTSTGQGTGSSGAATGQSEELVDGALPVTGTDDGPLMQDGRFWGAVLVLLLLVSGAVYRAKWSWSRSNR
ncbi:MAG: hypothetical protein H6631_05220 [Anaerolineaceae bacterium]|nr:hypothetical protein [Anaerolineaceae bacterium]MCB9100970.1 hypothetical protein [Anaerolineales bacterium]